MLLTLLGLVAVAVVVFLATYTVVDPNEAHIIVFMGRGRKLYSARDVNGRVSTSYFYIPFLMKRQVLPLTNVKMDIEHIPLNDKEVAPFVCDVIAWLNISDPIVAAERLNFEHEDGVFGSLREDLINIVQSIARAVAMKQEILDIMRDRKTFSESVSAEVNGVLHSWGIDLVNLEVNDIRDDSSRKSSVITNYEMMRRAQVESLARKEVAERDREAVEVEQENRRKAETAKAEAERAFTEKQIEKDKAIGIAKQTQEREVWKSAEEANKQKVLATRTLEVGVASVKKEAAIEVAQGEAEAVRVKGEKEAEVKRLTGEAEAKAIEAKGLAEAVAKDKMAEALKKYNDAATTVEKIKAGVEVQKAFAEAYGKIAEKAEIKIVNSGKGGTLFGFDLNAENGANLGQMLEGFDLNKLAALLGKKEEKR